MFDDLHNRQDHHYQVDVCTPDIHDSSSYYRYYFVIHQCCSCVTQMLIVKDGSYGVMTSCVVTSCAADDAVMTSCFVGAVMTSLV